MLKIKFIITLWIAKLIAFAVNIIDKNRGTNYSGKIAVRLMPDFIAHFRGTDLDRTVMITGTNGKSTTTNLIAHSLKTAGLHVASNVEGANMMGGVATTLIKNSSLGGRFNKDCLVLEIDERSLPAIYKLLPARHIGITNLQKDQAQRNGDPDFIYRKLASAIGKDSCLYLNNEEPRSKGLASCVDRCVSYSVAPNSKSFEKHDFYDVSLPCPICGRAIKYSLFNLESIGFFSCPHCGHRSEENPDVQISGVSFENSCFEFEGKTYTVNYSNPFYFYNSAM
ncbi:MAG: Mur ligase family protein, partial [Oscillospiraceae bacterium]|nr:Mur ligase family protein [Oscillospiraceae bacterium]